MMMVSRFLGLVFVVGLSRGEDCCSNNLVSVTMRALTTTIYADSTEPPNIYDVGRYIHNKKHIIACAISVHFFQVLKRL